MKRNSMIAGVAFVAVFLALAVLAGYRAIDGVLRSPEETPVTSPPSPTASRPSATVPSHAAAASYQGFLYGRVMTLEGNTFEGRLRFGGSEEAFWGNYFNGSKRENPWAALVPPGRLPTETRAFEILGFRFGERERPINLDRLFMARFGDIARIDANARDVRVTLKSGTVFDLDRFDASDFDDGVRVWDVDRGIVDLDSMRIRAIEFLPDPLAGDAPYRLHGTVRTQTGDFTGFIQWNREECVGDDELYGRTDEREVALRFDTIASIKRGAHGGAMVTLLDGSAIELSGVRSHRGIYVDDPRYGRVLVSWGTFVGVDFSPGGSGPAYAEYPAGRPLTGRVTTRSGQRLVGRLIYDLDESETVETLDAPSAGIDYTIPFGLIDSIVAHGREEIAPERARVLLRSGEELYLERAGDLQDRNAGMLVFVDGQEHPEYVRWADIQHIEFDRPPATYPPFDRG